MDREFIADIERDERGAALVSGVIDLGRRLGMDVVAEGVETAGPDAHARRTWAAPISRAGASAARWTTASCAEVLGAFDPAVLDADPVAEMDSAVHTVGQAG